MCALYTNHFYHTYKKDVYSQNGEDGILEELLKRLNISTGWVCEFGAWDGIHLSNTFRLVEKGFQAVFIEGDPLKYQDLLKTAEKYNTIHPIQAFVDYKDTPQSLDNLLARTPIPIDFDVLSIDIDSYDYHVWKSVQTYRPKIVIIEINSSVHTDHGEYIHDSVRYQGTGFKPTFLLGIEKGYTFVLHTGNMFFVRNDLFDALNIHYNHPLEHFRADWVNKNVSKRSVKQRTFKPLTFF